MPRAPFSLGGVEYPLDHLRSFRLEVAHKDPLAGPALLRVTYSCHVFSEGWDAERHSPDHLIEEDGEQRAFCAVRYGCSINLPALLKYHCAGKAFKRRDRNGYWNNFFYAEADGVPYPVFFSLTRADKKADVDGILHIKSAYQDADLMAKHRYESVKFARLVHLTCPPKATK